MAGRRLAKSSRSLRRRQQPGLGALVVSDAVPFRAADGAEHHGVGLKRASHGRIGDRLAMGIVGAAADKVGLGLDARRPARIDPGDHALDLGHHFGADAVAGKKQEFVGSHEFAPTLC